MAHNDLENYFMDYLAADPPQSFEAIYSILERFNAPWLYGEGAIRAIDRDARSVAIPDFCTGEPSVFGAPLPFLERIPFLYRLHRLHQLSTVGVSTHFGARHSRFSHSVGVVGIAALMLEALSRRFDGAEHKIVSEAYESLQDEIVPTACLAYCALHDAFHGPFGHSLDIMKDVFGVSSSEKLDNKYLREGLSAAISGKPDPIGRQLRLAAELWVDTERVDEFLELVLLLSRKSELLASKPHLYFLHQIANSLVDADRLDYIVRDGLYLEAKDYSTAYRALIKSLRIVDWPRRTEGSKAVNEHDLEPIRACLAFEISTEEAAADLLGKRREYYTRYYEKAEKLVIDDMICHALAYILDDKKIPDRAPVGSERVVGNIRRNIMFLTDESFVPAMLELKADPACYDLIFRFMQRQFFEVVISIPVRLDEVMDTKMAVKAWSDLVTSFLQEKADRAGVLYAAKLISEDDIAEARTVFPQHLQQVISRVDEGMEEKILSFGFQYWVQAAFRQRQRFERNVWRRLSHDERREDQLNRIAEREFGDVAARDRLENFPPLHVTTSSYFAMLDKRDVQLQRKEGQGVEDLLFYNLDDGTVQEKAVKPNTKEDRASYPLVLSALPSVIQEFGSDAVRAAFFEELRSLSWLVDRFSPE